MREVGTLTQNLAGHEGAIGLAEITLRGLARQCGPAFSAGVDGSKIRLLWCGGVNCRIRILLLHPVFTLGTDLSFFWSSLAIYVFDSLYC